MKADLPSDRRPPSPASPVAPYPGPGLAWYVTFLLTCAYMLSFVDRQILNLLVEPIRKDLAISDTQISLLQGFAFVATYILFSIPLGRLVDTGRRTFLIAGGITFWSLATAACGLTRSFGGLFAARACVGIGEATLTPAAWSLIADHYPPDKRATPISVFLMGPYLGAGMALILGGQVMGMLSEVEAVALPLLGDVRPWQLTFILVAAPGLVFALLMMLVPEPARKGLLPDAPRSRPVGLREIGTFICSRGRIYAALLLGVPCLIVILYGLQAWVPTYLVRVHGMSLSAAGLGYGTIALVAGSAGVLLGPVVGRKLKARGYVDYHLRLPVACAALLSPPNARLCLG